jgi:LytS/YehU family sensor histidine kinase
LAFFFSLALRIGNRWKQAERERITAELSHLKAQVNPHFLFNTLNSIYSLALEKSDDTADAVVRLSGMMRYVISEADKDFVSLEKEIRYVCDYVDLQKLRFGSAVHLDFKVVGDLTGKKIAPLILIPFVENAFKHGVNPEIDSDILIHILIKDGRLEMIVKNKILPSVQQETLRNGLGVENTRNRLKHLYPSSHVLNIRESENEFLVEMNIGLI